MDLGFGMGVAALALIRYNAIIKQQLACYGND